MDEALHKVGLSLREVAGRYAHELSGGQLQRVAIARALIPNPSLLIADEPVSMVDASLRMSIVNLLRDLRDEFGVSVIYITHDLATAYYISDRLVIMQKGYVVEMGPARPILDAPEHPYSRLLKESVLSIDDAGTDALVPADRSEAIGGLGTGGRGDPSGTRGWPLRPAGCSGARRTIVHETGGNGTTISPSTSGVATTRRAGVRGRGRPRCCWRGGRRRRAGGIRRPRPGRRAAGCRRSTARWHRASG